MSRKQRPLTDTFASIGWMQQFSTQRLDVDIATVKSHITRVLAKLGVRTRHEAAERARALGLGNGW